MTGLDRREEKHADMLAHALWVVQKKAIAAEVGSLEGDPRTLDEAADFMESGRLARELSDAIEKVLELSNNMPTNDDGRGTGPVHRGYAARLAEHEFPLNPGATGEYAVVQIRIDEEDGTLPLQIGFSARTGGNV